MLEKIIAIILFIVGIINILPLVVFFDASKTAKMYGFPLEGESLIVLMRHRGVLLALLGGGLIYSVFKPEFRLPIIIAALISKSVFVFLTYTTANISPEVGKVALIDIVSIVVLLVVSAIEFTAK
jgi:hypothetical protein